MYIQDLQACIYKVVKGMLSEYFVSLFEYLHLSVDIEFDFITR